MAGKPRIVWQALLLKNGSESIRPIEARTLSRHTRRMTWWNDSPEKWQGMTSILIGVKQVGNKQVGEEVGYFNFLESEDIAHRWLEWQKDRLRQQEIQSTEANCAEAHHEHA